MLPIPNHLKEILQADADTSDESNVNGSLRCICGCQNFKIKVYAEIDSNKCPHVTEYKNGYAFVVKAVCRDCGKEWPVFDMSKHGYNGFICHDGVTVPDTELKEYSCAKCGENAFEITIGIETEDKEQFIEDVVNEYLDKYAENDYIDAFDWIVISIKCASCGHTIGDWVNFETA